MIRKLLDELSMLKNIKKDSISKYPTGCESDILPFKLPSDLKEFYKWLYDINCFDNTKMFWFMDQGIFRLDEAIYQRNHLAILDVKDKQPNWPWPLAWLPIGFKMDSLLVAVLSKKNGEKTLLLECDLGIGDTNGYVFFSNLEDFLKAEIDIAKYVNLDVDFLSVDRNAIDAIVKQHAPNSYYASDNAYSENHFNSQGYRNVFDIFDLATIPREWL